MLVNIDVPDLAAAERFYTHAFELRVGRRFGRGALELLGGTSPIYLLVNAAGSKATEGGATRTYERHWTPVHLDFDVPDLEAAIARVLAAGAIQETAIRESAWGRIASFADPLGHGFCLLQFSERGYDAIAT
jgi:predicted enzyme related to lactoylglutathione lyase